MPLEIDSDDFKKVALATLVPGAASALGYAAFLTDKSIFDWWKQLKKPSWAPESIWFYTTVDLLTTAPLGCASYLVYKHGGGFDHADTTAALVAYGATLGISVISIPLMKKKDTKTALAVCAAVTATSSMAAALSYKIHPTAGLMMAPMALWCGYYTALFYDIWRNEKQPAP